MPRQRATAALLATIVLTATAPASLRVRHCYPMNHSPDADPNGDLEKMDTTWWNKIHPGAWDGYDESTGFDTVANSDLGSFDNAPYVTSSYWIDSMFGDRTNGALIDGAATRSDLRDTSFQLGLDGYFLFLYGQLTIPVTGDYEFYVGGDDGGAIVWLDLNRDGIDEGDTLGVSKADLSGAFYTAGDPSSWKGARYSKKTIQAGKYQFRGWKWDWGEVSHGGFFWKMPGSDQVVPVPSSAFGKRRNYGVPRVVLTRVLKNGVDVPEQNWGNIDATPCDTFTFHARAVNFQAGDTAVFKWDFNDLTQPVQTLDTIVSHVFLPDPAAFFISPKVRVMRGTAQSEPLQQALFLFMGPCDSSASAGGSPTVHTQRLGMTGSLLRLGPDPRLVEFYGPDGRKALAWHSGHLAAVHQIDLGTLGLAGGYHIARVVDGDGRQVTLPFIVRR